MITVLQPALIALIGVVILTVALAIILPILNIYNNIGTPSVIMTSRSFGALILRMTVSAFVEYRAERTGIRIIEQWADTGRPRRSTGARSLLALLDAPSVPARKSPWRSSSSASFIT
jgi:hypothetical protein